MMTNAMLLLATAAPLHLARSASAPPTDREKALLSPPMVRRLYSHIFYTSGAVSESAP
jgi:hypothetical protein